MPESVTHARLVRAILDFIDSDFRALTDIAIRDDSNAPVRDERPPAVGGFVPDVYATDVPTTVTLIGEAKTKRDLEAIHSQEQITAFLEYLKVTAGGVFILSVPLTAGATARRIVTETTQRLGGAPTRLVVLDGLG
ncbi:hypothetical protein [Mesorhizobium sp. L-2-11]|uniref:hypothetical protein n=1 Tax=Mesorhizobium sp. L-2-11 TaxID=2744521 RepID=UPI0019254D3D|nr:hypothetical protein [Mesorhizobium sp. L-2-11]BCH13694.1 hypothetical protein MesoLjLa_05450 [Mesorhizobium sp. L-2-11]